MTAEFTVRVEARFESAHYLREAGRMIGQTRLPPLPQIGHPEAQAGLFTPRAQSAFDRPALVPVNIPPFAFSRPQCTPRPLGFFGPARAARARSHP